MQFGVSGTTEIVQSESDSSFGSPSPRTSFESDMDDRTADSGEASGTGRISHQAKQRVRSMYIRSKSFGRKIVSQRRRDFAIARTEQQVAVL